MTVDEITRRLEQLDSALRLVETEGRDLEEKIRKGTCDTHSAPVSSVAQPATSCFMFFYLSVLCVLFVTNRAMLAQSQIANRT